MSWNHTYDILFILLHFNNEYLFSLKVIGIPHERLGEEICACIRLRKGSDLSYESLVEFCTGNMAYFKIPKQLLIRDSFPKTQSGKIQKHLLKQEILNFIK